MQSPFNNGVELKVIGERDVSPEQLIPVESRLYKAGVCRQEGIGDLRIHVDHIVAVDPFQRYPCHESTETPGHNEATITSTSVGECPVTVTICHVTIQRLDEKGLEVRTGNKLNNSAVVKLL